MLTSEQIEGLRQAFQNYGQNLEDGIINFLVSRICEAAKITSMSEYRSWQAKNLCTFERDLEKALSNYLNITKKQASELMERAADSIIKNDLKVVGRESGFGGYVERNRNLIAETIANASLGLDNITKTSGFIGPYGNFASIPDSYKVACDVAFSETFSGGKSYLDALTDACRGLYSNGIQVVNYESGLKTTIEIAIRRSLLSSMGSMQDKIEHIMSEELGTDGWEISAHAYSAPDHEPIQGRQYSNEEYENLNNSLQRQIGTLNCGHAAFPIMIGQEPQYSESELRAFRDQNERGKTIDGKHYTGYQLTQKQREIERAIRKTKRKANVYEKIGDTKRLEKTQTRIQMLDQYYRKFSRRAGLRLQKERLFIESE